MSRVCFGGGSDRTEPVKTLTAEETAKIKKDQAAKKTASASYYSGRKESGVKIKGYENPAKSTEGAAVVIAGSAAAVVSPEAPTTTDAAVGSLLE